MITGQDIFLIVFLAFLEGLLSIDNALVLAMMAKPLPKDLQKKALTYGLVGAVVFRLIALSMVTYLIRWNWVKFVGGGYLVIVAGKHFWSRSQEKEHVPNVSRASFWKIVMMIELMDIAFAVDSILAAVALSQKFWVVFAGGMMGVVMMRFAATVFIRLLARFPNFETTAYLLVGLIGLKLVVDGFKFPGVDFHSASQPAFWIFWGSMALCILMGFRRSRKLS